MIQALTGAISAITSLLWLGLAVCVLIYLRRPIRELAHNVARATSGIIEISTRHIRVEWRSIATAAVNLTAAAFKKEEGEQELPRIVNSVATSVEVAASGAAAKALHTALRVGEEGFAPPSVSFIVASLHCRLGPHICGARPTQLWGFERTVPCAGAARHPMGYPTRAGRAIAGMAQAP